MGLHRCEYISFICREMYLEYPLNVEWRTRAGSDRAKLTPALFQCRDFTAFSGGSVFISLFLGNVCAGDIKLFSVINAPGLIEMDAGNYSARICPSPLYGHFICGGDVDIHKDIVIWSVFENVLRR